MKYTARGFRNKSYNHEYLGTSDNLTELITRVKSLQHVDYASITMVKETFEHGGQNYVIERLLWDTYNEFDIVSYATIEQEKE